MLYIFIISTSILIVCCAILFGINVHQSLLDWPEIAYIEPLALVAIGLFGVVAISIVVLVTLLLNKIMGCDQHSVNASTVAVGVRLLSGIQWVSGLGIAGIAVLSGVLMIAARSMHPVLVTLTLLSIVSLGSLIGLAHTWTMKLHHITSLQDSK